jgi:hypothetical protein
MDIAFTRINASTEVMTKVWLQLCDLKDAIQIPEERKHSLFTWAMDVTRKLESVKYHRDNLLRVLNEEFQKRASNTAPTNATFIEVNTGAEKEFEAFLLQGKSTLDILVKVFVPLFGIKLHSYGDGGEKVARTLKRNLNAEQLARAEPLLTLIAQDKEWIEKWFCGHRDTVAHYKPISSSGFVTPPVIDGIPRHVPPATSDGVAFHDAVAVLYTNLLTFAEDFLALSVNITFLPVFTVGVLPFDRRDRGCK